MSSTMLHKGVTCIEIFFHSNMPTVLHAYLHIAMHLLPFVHNLLRRATCDKFEGGPEVVLQEFDTALETCVMAGDLVQGDAARLRHSAMMDMFVSLHTSLDEQRKRSNHHDLVTKANSDMLELSQAREKALKHPTFEQRYPLTNEVASKVKEVC